MVCPLMHALSWNILFACCIDKKNPHNSKKASLVPLIKSCSRRRKPSTTGSLDIHIQRAHYIAMIWRKADENHLCLPAIAAFGWTFDTGSSHFSPVQCLNPPVPEARLHLIKCRCKSRCEGRSSYCKSNISCTEFCGCWVFTCNNKTS